MASNGSIDSGGYQGRCLRFEWGTNNTNAETNVRNIWYRITAVGGTSSYYYHHNNTVEINGSLVYDGSSSEQIWTDTVLASGNMDINQNNYSNLAVSMHGGIYYSSDNIDTDYSWGLDEIPRYAEIESFSIQSIGLNSAVLYYKVSRNANIYCSVDGGAYGNPRVTNTTSGTFTITGLSTNTRHSFKILSKATLSGLDRESGTIYGTTKDIGRISNLNNFNHGNNVSFTITNPSGSSLSLVMKIGNTQILSKTVSTGSNTITFTDAQLDSIYRLYGSSNTLTATFILTTAGSYTDTKTATITLTGNQKTAYTTGRKRAKVYVGLNGSVKKAVVWVGNNGRKRCI